jgi:hypothetical protein
MLRRRYGQYIISWRTAWDGGTTRVALPCRTVGCISTKGALAGGPASRAQFSAQINPSLYRRASVSARGPYCGTIYGVDRSKAGAEYTGCSAPTEGVSEVVSGPDEDEIAGVCVDDLLSWQFDDAVKDTAVSYDSEYLCCSAHRGKYACSAGL